MNASPSNGLIDTGEWLPIVRPHALEAGDVHVWRVSLSADVQDVTMARAILCDEERKRAARFLQAAHGDRFTLCRAALRRLIGAYLHVEPAEVVFRYGRHGKPSVDLGAKSADFAFNLAHSGALALIAFGRGCRLGIDLEEINPDREYQKIAHRFFNAGEVAVLDGLAPKERLHAFYQGWTRKEAFIKAHGMGLAMSLDSFEVALGPADQPRVIRLEGALGAADTWSIVPLAASPRFAAALAVDVPSNVQLFQPRQDRHAERFAGI